jgi:hypothetical protein
MFLLAVIEDKLKTVPEEFDRDATEVGWYSSHYARNEFYCYNRYDPLSR